MQRDSSTLREAVDIYQEWQDWACEKWWDAHCRIAGSMPPLQGFAYSTPPHSHVAVRMALDVIGKHMEGESHEMEQDAAE